MKKILGLDLGTNSIGWAVLNAADDNSLKYIEAAGSRIIPMDAAILGDFDRGNQFLKRQSEQEFVECVIYENDICFVEQDYIEF